MNVKEYRELYEGLTQETEDFRTAIYTLSESVPESELFSGLDRVQNRLNHAMLGVHPIHRREVELSGIIDYKEELLRLYAPDGEQTLLFRDLDPDYVRFLEQLKETYQAEDVLPFSSIALKTSNEWLFRDGVDVPDLSSVQMNLPEEEFPYSRKVLEEAFARSMVLMNHLYEELEKHGLDRAYGANREDLIQYVQSDSFNFQFDHSVRELTETAKQAAMMDSMENQ